MTHGTDKYNSSVFNFQTLNKVDKNLKLFLSKTAESTTKSCKEIKFTIILRKNENHVKELQSISKQKNTDITDVNNKKITGYQTALQNRIKGLKLQVNFEKLQSTRNIKDGHLESITESNQYII